MTIWHIPAGKDFFNQHRTGMLSHVEGWLADGGDRRGSDAGGLYIVKTDDGELIRHFDPEAVGCTDGCGCKDIGTGEKCIRTLAGGEQL